jgi:hypothetical protein
MAATVVEVPVFPQLGAFEERVVLDGTPYALSGRFNTRMQRWVLDVRAEDGSDIVLGLPLVADWNLADPFKGRIPGLWSGELYTLDLTGRRRAADADNLGKDVKLLYMQAGA